jgi:hypothetical protein
VVPNGEPSVHDFQVHELLRVVEQFAVAGRLAPDGAIELIRLRLDLDAGWE